MYVWQKNRYQSELPKAIEKPWMNLSALVTTSPEPPFSSVRFEKLGSVYFLTGPIQTMRRKKERRDGIVIWFLLQDYFHRGVFGYSGRMVKDA